MRPIGPAGDGAGRVEAGKQGEQSRFALILECVFYAFNVVIFYGIVVREGSLMKRSCESSYGDLVVTASLCI